MLEAESENVRSDIESRRDLIQRVAKERSKVEASHGKLHAKASELKQEVSKGLGCTTGKKKGKRAIQNEKSVSGCV